MFKPVYLYVKTHNKTGLKYFGKTTNKNPFKYKGSGKRWLNHIRYHGNDVTTEIVGYFLSKEECIDFALKFSENNNIVESSEWANLEPEDGMQGGVGENIGTKNGSYGTRWITNGEHNKKINNTTSIPDGWKYGMTMPPNWGENISKKLKGRTHIEMLGEDKAKELSKKKSERGKRLKYWGKNAKKLQQKTQT